MARPAIRPHPTTPDQSGMRTYRCRLRDRWFPCREKAISPGLAMRRALYEKAIRRGCGKAIQALWGKGRQIREWRTSFEWQGARRNDLRQRQRRGGGRECLLRRAFEWRRGARGLGAWALVRLGGKIYRRW